MKTFVDAGLGAEKVEEISQSVRRRVVGKEFQDFIIALLELSAESDGTTFTRAEIAGKADPNRKEFRSNYWAKDKKLFDQFATHQAYLSKGLHGHFLAMHCAAEGRPFRYRIGIVDELFEPIPFQIAGSVLRYRTSDSPPRLSLIGRITHPGVGEHREHYRKLLFLTPFFVLCGVFVLCGLLLSFTTVVAFRGGDVPVSTFVTLFVAASLIGWSLYRKWDRLFEDRILLLGMGDVADDDRGVVLDLEETEGKRSVVLRRYVAGCPICRAPTITLSRGNPEFRRRIVGRCDNSPREHVFSFDRVTLEGAPLRLHPTVINPERTYQMEAQPDAEV
jgi:hypothetical protein